MKRKVVVVYLLIHVVRSDAKLPNYIHPCPRQTGNNNSCVEESIQNAIHLIKDGAKPFPSLNPLHFPSTSQKIKNPLMDIQVNLTNVNVYGLSNFSIKSSRFTHRSNEFHLIFPKIRIIGSLMMNIHVGAFDGNGIQGVFNLTSKNFEVFVKAKSKIVKLHDVEHLIFKAVDLKFWIDGYRLFVELDGYHHIEIGINTWPMFQNNRLVIDSIVPKLEEESEDLLTMWLHEMIARYPFEAIAPKKSSLKIKN